jgi:sigma-B regulation protein RsbU (phosphoserine phosphatase)
MYQIVIIEQEPITRRRLQRALQALGYRVTTSANSQRGVEQAIQLQAALVLCDWQTLHSGEIPVIDQIRSEPSLASTFIILLGERANLHERVQGLNAGADEFLVKPIDPLELEARVGAGLRWHQLHQESETQRRLAEERHRQTEAELIEATRYMRSLLPPPMGAPLAIDFRYLPSHHLGGDCLDYFWLAPDQLAMYLMDVSGHGVGATLLAITVLHVLRNRTFLGVDFSQPSAVLAALNHHFPMTHHGKYLTIWYGLYNRQSGQLTYASAGHPPGMLLIPGETTADPPSLRPLKTRGFPIGLFPEASYQQADCEVPKGSILYLFSDGIYDFPLSTGATCGLEGFTTLVQASQSLPLDDLLALLREHSVDHQFMDDLSLMQICL